MARFSRALLPVCLISLLLCTCAVACSPEPTDTDTSSAEQTIHSVETEVPTMSDTTTEIPPESGSPATDVENEPATEPATEPETLPPYSGTDGKTINLASELANGVTGFFTSDLNRGFMIENRNAHLLYNLNDPAAPYRVSSLTDPEGNPYLSDTGDSFIRLENGKTLYASGTVGRVNVYDQGYYYYDVHVLDQTFIDDSAILQESRIDLHNFAGHNDLRKVTKQDDGSLSLTISKSYDPYICYTDLSFDTSVYNAALVTLRVEKATSAELFFVSGKQTGFNGNQRISFPVLADGEYHTYTINLARGNDYTGTLSALRLDIGSAAGEVIDIAAIRMVAYDASVPQITLDRNFISYSDKINDVVRFMADEAVTGVAAIGTEWRIPADAVAKLTIGDANGHHASLTEVDWDSAAYIGLDIREVGVLGIILLPHETSGRLSVELTDGSYIIRQAYAPTDGNLAKGSSTYVGHRLYTDTTHDFAAFLYEAACEREPLQGVTVMDDRKNAYYVGYNPLRGAYEFNLRNGGSFAYLFQNPGEEFSVTFELAGSERDRQIYILAATTNGCLEGSAVLDRYNRMLPVRVEVCKNFAGDGEELYYTDNDRHAYGYAIFPMTVEAGATERLTVLHLYEQWGGFRLKQVSSIRFHQAYYHMSTGVTETNCIAFYDYLGNRLPDHRAMSQPFWRDTYFSALDPDGNPVGSKKVYSDQPQHENNGTHTFLRYTDAEGNVISTVNRRHDISSSGPTYFDLTMSYVTGDGLMEADIRHMEMAQYDENRAYYELDYRVNGEIGFKNFKSSFEIYAMTTNRSLQYEKLGYLDADGNSVIQDANSRTRVVYHVPGMEHPYFDYFHLTDPDPSKLDQNDVYSNISALIKDWDIVIGGKPYTGPLILREKENRLVLTLDLEEVTLLPGDYIHINMILMPWGDRTSADDSNVRLTRENTLLHPIVVTPVENVTVSDDPFLPTARSIDGLSATFTISGGLDNIDRIGYASEGNTAYTNHYDRDYNIAVRVCGLRDFGTPGLYELIDGEWVAVTLCSEWGYDGYTVLYDADNSFSYCFNINMDQATPRTFRLVVE